MMKSVQNEKGYTLLLTLVIIAIIVIFFSSFTLSAMNQQKQVQKTDETYEVTAIAEMGVEYYKAKLLNELEQARLETEPLLKNNKLNETERNVPLNSLRSRILQYPFVSESTTNQENGKTTLEDSSNYFALSKQPVFNTDFTSLEIEVYGRIKTTGKTKKVAVKFNFPLNLYTKGAPGSGSGSGSNQNWTPLLTSSDFPEVFPSDFYTKILPNCSKSTIEKDCRTNSIGTLNGETTLNFKEVYYQVDESKNDSIKNITRGDIYGISKLFVKGNLKSNGIGWSKLNNKLIFVDGNTVFAELAESSNATIITTGNFETGNFNLSSSKLKVDGTADFGWSRFSGTKILVQNSTIFKGATDILDSTLQFQSNISFKDYSLIADSNLQVLGSSAFTQFQFNNSNIQLNDSTIISDKWSQVNNSNVVFNGNTTTSYKQGSTISIIGNSKVCFKSLSNNIQLKINNESIVYMPNSITHTNFEWGSKLPLYVSEDVFKTNCSIGINNITPNPINNPQNKDEFIAEVKYQ